MPDDQKIPWKPIEDYLIPADKLKAPELAGISALWQEQRDTLEKNHGVEEFFKHLRRQWAIETGLIENLYTLDRGITQMLIKHGINAALIPHTNGNSSSEHVAAMIRDHHRAIEGLFSFVSAKRPMTVSYIKEMHAQLTQHQYTTSGVDSLGRRVEMDLLRGDFKKTPNNPTRPDGIVHEYCPPEHVGSEMERLIKLYHSHRDTAVEVEAAWLHHRFVQIHPFQDGNGRVARCLATLVFIKAGWFPLVIRNKDREGYIDALGAADGGDLAPLVELFAKRQKDSFIHALSSVRTLHATAKIAVDAATSELAARIGDRSKVIHKKWERAKSMAERMNNIAYEEFANRVIQLDDGNSHDDTSRPKFRTDSQSDKDQDSYYFHRQIVESVKQLDYYANFRAFRAWSRLTMQSDWQGNILLSFHGLGPHYRGVIAACICEFRRSQTEDGSWENTESVPLSSEVFQINYLGAEEDIKEGFIKWLDESLAQGLRVWSNELGS